MFRGFLKVGSSIVLSIVHQVIPTRSLYGVRHNANRGIFYVRLKNDDTAVLRYKANGKILDMQSINVPQQYQGRGLARLLAEVQNKKYITATLAAFTYAIIHGYYMLLTCKYMQKLYRATKNPELEERVIGPKHILQGPEAGALDPESVYDLPDPEDFT